MEAEEPGVIRTFEEQLQIIPVGFEALDLERLKKMFQGAPQTSRRYVVAASATPKNRDVLLVNHDHPGAVRERDALLRAAPDAVVVAVSRGPLADAPAYHIRGMLIAAKVLSVLDKIPSWSEAPRPDSAPAEAPESGLKQPAPPSLATVPPLPPAAAAVPDAVPGYRALVVDDSAAIQKSLELNLRALESIGTIDFADDGESALEKARTNQYDLIFLDVMMPGIDGYETCTRLRKLPEYKKIPIIMVSGKTSPLDEVKGIMAGCTTYLTKPVQSEAFQKLAGRVLAWLAEYRPAPNPPK